MKTLMAVTLLFGVAFTLSAQEKKAAGEHSMTGCLQKGTAPNSYRALGADLTCLSDAPE